MVHQISGYVLEISVLHSPFIFLAVYGLYVIDLVQTCSATYDAFQWFVIGWGNVDMLYRLYTSWLNVPILSSVVGFVVQVGSLWRRVQDNS
jgi:hypothetical protein